jgi:hypothetical protein
MKKKHSRENELKELLKENPDILMEFLEDWKEACEINNKKEKSKLTPEQEANLNPFLQSINSTAPGAYTLEELEYLGSIS